ncbi:MAG: hypothetical protein COA96_15775 [SAR86 cluster bacterium]|uniref:Uncharacterized protein n=1 Tax=SAR86 cluster bacterium TaxID=2030880 RepID=A0A2A5AP52_9GAMM|nr:MAG: hypothetical protein COA96_15775 [SAR86 cluster bacterium]
MKILTLIFITLFATACGEQTAPIQKPQLQSVFILFENGGTIAEADQDDARNTMLNLLQQLSEMDRRKATRNAQINIVLGALPNRIAWSGTPRQLLEQVEDIKALLTFKQSFNDLVMAFDQIQTTINLTQPDDIRLYWIGSTVHVPFQDTGTAITVEVPQPVPDNLALSSFADVLSVLKVYRVHEDQDQILLAYFAAQGVLTRAREGSLDFSLFGSAQTKSSLSDLL